MTKNTNMPYKGDDSAKNETSKTATVKIIVAMAYIIVLSLYMSFIAKLSLTNVSVHKTILKDKLKDNQCLKGNETERMQKMSAKIELFVITKCVICDLAIKKFLCGCLSCGANHCASCMAKFYNEDYDCKLCSGNSDDGYLLRSKTLSAQLRKIPKLRLKKMVTRH